MRIDDLFKLNSENNEEHWISISDLMAGLMIIFLFIAIFYNFQKEEEVEHIKEIDTILEEIKQFINNELSREFKNDWQELNAEPIEEELAVRFKVTPPEILFERGEDYLEEIFRKRLDIFFPRYLKILYKIKECISEIRIEGHTSSEWKGVHPPKHDYFESKDISIGYDNYFSNMGLSQDRSKEVLKYSLLLPIPIEKRNWVKDISTANGLSSSDTILKNNGEEDAEASRRVEFKIVLDRENVVTKKCGAPL